MSSENWMNQQEPETGSYFIPFSWEFQQINRSQTIPNFRLAMCPSPLRRVWPLEGHGQGPQGPQGPPLHGRPCSAGSFKIPIGWFLPGWTLPLIHGYIGWLLVWNMVFMTFHKFGNVIIPTDFHSIIFQRQKNIKKTTKQHGKNGSFTLFGD